MKEVRNLSKINATILADFILIKYGPMSHLKLQKLLYYTQAYHLAYFDTDLIPENFEAWVHGPVCREVYNTLRDKSILYSDVGFSGEHNPEDILSNSLTTDQMALIVDVNNELSTWSGIELETSTHSELPWISARTGLSPEAKSTTLISKDLMYEFYKKELYGKI